MCICVYFLPSCQLSHKISQNKFVFCMKLSHKLQHVIDNLGLQRLFVPIFGHFGSDSILAKIITRHNFVTLH